MILHEAVLHAARVGILKKLSVIWYKPRMALPDSAGLASTGNSRSSMLASMRFFR